MVAATRVSSASVVPEALTLDAPAVLAATLRVTEASATNVEVADIALATGRCAEAVAVRVEIADMTAAAWSEPCTPAAA